MKKWLWLLLVLIVLMLGFIYLVIPATVVTSAAIKVQVSDKSILRIVQNKKMPLWFVNNNATNGNFTYNKLKFSLEKKYQNAVAIAIINKNDSLQSDLLIIPTSVDATLIKWNATFQPTLNPLTRLRNYLQTQQLQKQLVILLHHFAAYVSETANSYQIHIKQIHLKDSLLLAKKFETKGYPSTQVIYQQIEQLRAYIAANNATVEDYPMLHVTTSDSTTFQCMIGLAVNKSISETNDYKIKRMPFGGYMLIANVQGGNAAIKQGFKNLENYVYDYNRRVPAIPFQLLVTDRSKITDTTKWSTVLYYPVE